MSIEQPMILKSAYTEMEEKLLKYEPHIKGNPIFPTSTILNPSLKLEYISLHEQ